MARPSAQVAILSICAVAASGPVQPPADVVADYTCYNGNDKRNKYRHALTPFLLPVWEATTK